MKTSTRRRPSEVLPGIQGTARVDRRIAELLPRLRRGDIAVVDVLDLDRATAQALVDAGVTAVVDASALISGRYPNLGPQLLAEAGVEMLDRVGPARLAAIKDGSTVRLYDGAVHVGDRAVAVGRAMDAETVEAEMAAARQGMLSQLQTFAHVSGEFLRREQDLLIHGEGLPDLRTSMSGRPVVVVADGRELATLRKRLRPFLREQRPVLVAVDQGADALVAAGYRPDVVLVSEDAEPPGSKAVKAARDVLVVVQPGATRASSERLERMGARPLRLETTAAAEDAALLIADAAGARVIVGVGTHASLEEFLDRTRADLARAYLTRLKVGARLVDASAVPTLYSGRIRPRHVLLVMLFCLLVVAAAIASTPVGQGWASDLHGWLGGVVDDVRGRL
jgi:uncharacterized membrane-anchored protein